MRYNRFGLEKEEIFLVLQLLKQFIIRISFIFRILKFLSFLSIKIYNYNFKFQNYLIFLFYFNSKTKIFHYFIFF